MTEPEFVHEIAQPLTGAANDYDALLELIGDARFVRRTPFEIKSKSKNKNTR